MPVDVTKNWKRRRVSNPASCAKGSFRVKKVGRGAKLRMLTVCCPKGHWRGGQCTAGMKLQSIAKPRRR